MCARNFAPVPLLAVLKHPLACLGRTRGALLADVRRLERKFLRGPRPGGGLAGLQGLLNSNGDDDGDAGPRALLAELGRAVQPIVDLPDPAALDVRLDGLEAACRALMARPDTPADRFWKSTRMAQTLPHFSRACENMRAFAWPFRTKTGRLCSICGLRVLWCATDRRAKAGCLSGACWKRV